MRTRELAEKTSTVYHVSYDKLVVEEGFNPRLDSSLDIEDLATSIADNGIRNPLRVFKRGDSFILNDGHRRHAAVTHNLSKGIAAPLFPVIVEDEKTYEERLADTLLSNDGVRFLPIEEAQIIKRLSEADWSFEKIAKHIGRSVWSVSSRLALISADPRIVKAVKDKKMSPTAAVVAARALSHAERTVPQEVIEAAMNGDKDANRRLVRSDNKGSIWLKKSQKARLIAWGQEEDLNAAAMKVAVACQILEIDLDSLKGLKLEFPEGFDVDALYAAVDALL